MLRSCMYAFLGISLYIIPIQSKVIIWDLGGVLFKENYLGLAHKIGIRRFLSYTLHDRQTPFIEPLVFDILSTFGRQEGPDFVCTKRGTYIPEIMKQWFMGTKNSADIIETVNKRVEELDQAGYFLSIRQKMLAMHTLKVMFDPTLIGNYMVPIRKGVKLLRECASLKNNDGTPKNKLFILSNWDIESFEILFKKNTQIFSHFDPNNIVISGYIGKVKPHKNCFEYLIKTYGLNPKDCIFIDDQEVNIKSAQALNMTALLFQKKNYKTLRKTLKELDAL